MRFTVAYLLLASLGALAAPQAPSASESPAVGPSDEPTTAAATAADTTAAANTSAANTAADTTALPVITSVPLSGTVPTGSGAGTVPPNPVTTGPTDNGTPPPVIGGIPRAKLRTLTDPQADEVIRVLLTNRRLSLREREAVIALVRALGRESRPTPGGSVTVTPTGPVSGPPTGPATGAATGPATAVTSATVVTDAPNTPVPTPETEVPAPAPQTEGPAPPASETGASSAAAEPTSAPEGETSAAGEATPAAETEATEGAEPTTSP